LWRQIFHNGLQAQATRLGRMLKVTRQGAAPTEAKSDVEHCPPVRSYIGDPTVISRYDNLYSPRMVAKNRKYKQYTIKTENNLRKLNYSTIYLAHQPVTWL